MVGPTTAVLLMATLRRGSGVHCWGLYFGRDGVGMLPGSQPLGRDHVWGPTWHVLRWMHLLHLLLLLRLRCRLRTGLW